MLRLSVVGLKNPSMRYPITARASISKLSCKIPKSVTNASNVIVAPTYNNRAFIRLSSNKTSTPSTNSQNKQQIKGNDEKKLTPEEEALLDEEDDDELEQVEKYLEPAQFDKFTKPYNPTQDGLSLKAEKENPFLDEEEDMFETEATAIQAKDQTEEELDEEDKEYDDDEVPPELKEVVEALDRDWPGWEEVFPKDGQPNPKFQAMIEEVLDSFSGKQQTNTFTNSGQINAEYARLSEVMDTVDSKYDEWKQRRKEFLQIVKKYRQTTYFGIPTARVRFGRASGLKPSALNPDLAVSLRQDEQPDVVSSPPPFHGGGCKHISLNRPAQYNPLNLETVEHLADLFKKWNENDVVYSVCLKGNGPAFIGGLDLKEMANSDDHVKRQYTFHLYSLMRTLSGMRKFYVPIANGVVGGPGVPIFMYGAAPYVTENAVITVTDPATGLYPLGTFEALNSTFPKWFSKFMLMTGYPVTAGHWSMMKGKYIPHSRVPELERRVSEVLSSKPERFFQALNEVEEPTFMTPDRIDDGGAFLSSKLELIGKAFNHTSVAKILEYLDAQKDTFASDLAKRMRQRSPIALLLIQLRYNIEAKREKSHQRRMEEIHAEVEAAKLAAEQVTPENVKAFLATLPEDVFGRGLVAMYDTACKATSQMKPLLNTIVPGRELTEEGVAKLKEGIDTRMKGVAFSVQDYIQAVWDTHSRPFLLSPDGATVYPWDPEYPKILYCMKPAEEREKLIQQWQDNQAEIVEKLKNPKNRDPNEATFQETEGIPGVGGIVLPEGGAFNWFAEEAARQHNEVIMRTTPEHNWEHLCQKIYYNKPGEPVDQEALLAKGGYIPGTEAGESTTEEPGQAKKEEITAEDKIQAEWERYTKELIKIRQMEARAFYRLAKSPEFSISVKSLLKKNPTSYWKPLEEYDFKTVVSYLMPGPDTAELDTAISALDNEPMPDFMEWRRAKKYRPYWNHAFTVDMDAEEAL